MSTATTTVLDALLEPFEARPLGLMRDEVAERERGAAFGEELNRLQGAEPNPVRDRLNTLWCLGQVSHEEFVALVGEIGRRGLFRAMEKEITRDGR